MRNGRRGYDLLENRNEHCQVTYVWYKLPLPLKVRSFVIFYGRRRDSVISGTSSGCRAHSRKKQPRCSSAVAMRD